MDRERTTVTPTSEVFIPWQVFLSSWLLGALAVFVSYLMTWLWSLQGWLQSATFAEWWTVAFLPYFKLAWPGMIIWGLVMFFPSAAVFGVRLGLENLLKAWVPYSPESWFRKVTRK